MSTLQPGHCPKCRRPWDETLPAMPGSTCALFHQHPGIGELVVQVTSGRHPDWTITKTEKGLEANPSGAEDWLSRGIAEPLYATVEAMMAAALAEINDVVWYKED